VKEEKLLKDNLIARWLDNRLNDDEKKLIDASGELEELKYVLDDIDTWKVKDFDVEAGLKDLEQRKKYVISPTPTKTSRSTWLSIAASILVLISTGYFSWNYFLNQDVHAQTLMAETKTVELPQGSVVKMDALTNIKYSKRNWKNNRVLELSGQAYFDVTKGDFTVKTNKGNIHVLGTQFNINTKGKKFKVICYEGKVRVTYRKHQMILTKGKSVTLENDELVPTTHDLEQPTWLNAYTKYNEATLATVVSDLEERFLVNIKLPNQYKELKFTGTLTHKSLDSALKTLFTSMEIEYIYNKQTKVITVK